MMSITSSRLYDLDKMAGVDPNEDPNPEGNEDAVLRWNACIRAIEQFQLKPAPAEDRPQPFLE